MLLVDFGKQLSQFDLLLKFMQLSGYVNHRKLKSASNDYLFVQDTIRLVE